MTIELIQETLKPLAGLNIKPGEMAKLTTHMWYQLVLLPKSVDITRIRTLSDAEAVGGRLHSRRGYNVVREMIKK